jgi:phage tail-like protein
MNVFKCSLAALLAVSMSALLVGDASAAPKRAYVATSFVLEIGGETAGYMSSVSGGNAYANVVKQPSPASPIVKKHIGQTSTEPIAVQLGIGMGKPLYDWISSMLRGEPKRMDGAVVGVDTQLKAVHRLDFSGALLTEVTFPKLAAGSNDPALMSLVLTPEQTVLSKPSGSVVPASTKRKTVVASNFRFELEGLNSSRVTKIDAFTVRQKLVADSVGEFQEPSVSPSELEIPDLTVTLSANGSETWEQWFEEFIVQGKHDERYEKRGRIVVLGPDLREELLEIKLSNVGIFALRRLDTASNKEAVVQLEAKLYVESMELNVKALP